MPAELMFPSPNRPGGWRIDLEDYRGLENESTDVLSMLRKNALYGTFSAPEEVDPRPYWRIRNQGRQGSCQGHGVVAAASWTFKLQTGDPNIDLSEQFAYIESQRVNGLVGRDQGSSLYGGSQVLLKKGICREDLWPYPNGYQTRPPGGFEACYEDAKRFMAREVQKLRNYDEIFEWLSTGMGGVWIGIRWGSSMSSSHITRFIPGGGGHSVAFLGYKKGGALWMANSWGRNYGDNGWALVEPEAVNQMARDSYTVFMGVTDLYGDAVKPRVIDWASNTIYD